MSMYRVLDMKNGGMLAITFSENDAKKVVSNYSNEKLDDGETIRYVYEECTQDNSQIISIVMQFFRFYASEFLDSPRFDHLAPGMDFVRVLEHIGYMIQSSCSDNDFDQLLDLIVSKIQMEKQNPSSE